MIVLGIEKTDIEELNYPYYLIVDDEVVRSFRKRGTALIELAAQIDKMIGVADND